VNSLETIAAAAAAAKMAFVLAGGHAVMVHGYARSTFDIDLIIRREDRAGWLKVANGLGFGLFHEGPNFIQFSPSSPTAAPLDLMFVNDDTFGRLMAEAVPGPPGVAGAKVVSLRHLLALKCHAIKHGHAGRIVKDADDVIHLVLANRLDMDAPETREIFLKYGTQELYEKVRRAADGE
jgi:hypothetical protein